MSDAEPPPAPRGSAVYGWFHSWRAAIRIARRDAWRSKGRSVLVLCMIALPIVGVSAADITIRSADLTRAEELDRDLGGADARYTDAYTGGLPVMQQPEHAGNYVTDDRGAKHGQDTADKPADVVKVLPRGARWISDVQGSALARTAHGMLDVQVRELRIEDPLASGIVTLLRGRLAADRKEVVATSAFLKKSGLHVGSRTRLRGLDTSYRIVGAVEYPSVLDEVALLARPGAVLDRLAEVTAVHGIDRYSLATSYLVSVSGGVTWDHVKQANTKGVVVTSRAVALNPPPHDEVPYYAKAGEYSFDSGATELVAVGVTIAAMAMLEICLLAGPAFAVGARRSRRQLGLVGTNGGDRRHIRAIVLSGGLVIGGVAAVVGVALGLALTLALRPVLEGYVSQRFGSIELRPLELLAIALTGLVTGLLAAVVPAVVASRQSVLEALTGRRGVRRSSRVLPVIGLGAVVVGVCTAVVGSMTTDSVLPAAVGSAIAELGVVAMTPALVGLFGRLGRWLPLSPRLALRDAVRNRGRTAPAVAAVLAAVAGTVAVAMYMASDEQQQREEYQAALPPGRVAVGVGPEELPQLPQIRAAVAKHLPVDEQADVRRVMPGTKDCGPYPTDDPDCGSAALQVPPSHTCPALNQEEEPSPAEWHKYRDDWRCKEQASGLLPLDTEGQILVGGPAVLRALDIHDAAAERALEHGHAVIFDRRYLADGKVTLALAERIGTESDESERRVPIPAYLSHADSYQLHALIPERALTSAGVRTAPYGAFYTTAKEPSSAAEQKLKDSLSKLGFTGQLYIERGFPPKDSIVMLSLAVFAGLVTIGAAGIATGLAQADSEADLATLAAIGAAPRVRKALSGFQCGMVAAMGVVLGTAAGIVPAVALRKVEERAALDDPRWGYDAAQVHVPIVVPWETLLELLVVVPLGAALLAALVTRSRTALTRRTA